MIIALSGRRVDAFKAEQPRFPLENVACVKDEVRRMLQSQQVTAVVSSAACGADLIVLSEAGSLGLRRRVVLPFEPKRFRETSVVDRPGDWGTIYDQVIDQVETNGDLVVLGKTDQDDPYAATNKVILSEAIALAGQTKEPVGALLIWEGASRGKEDFTESLGAEARKLALPVFEILTK
jgi:hypothetical protein